MGTFDSLVSVSLTVPRQYQKVLSAENIRFFLRMSNRSCRFGNVRKVRDAFSLLQSMGTVESRRHDECGPLDPFLDTEVSPHEVATVNVFAWLRKFHIPGAEVVAARAKSAGLSSGRNLMQAG